MVKVQPRLPEAKLQSGREQVKPKAVNPTEEARRRHNESVRAAAAKAAGHRYAFLGRHIDALSPFITPAVKATIQ